MNSKSWLQTSREALNTPAVAAPARPNAPLTPHQPPAAPADLGQNHITPAGSSPTAQTSARSTAPASPAQLMVGPNIRLSGAQIEQCDTLVVEGHVKASIQSRSLHVENSGTFEGAAHIDVAEIDGSFNGELTAKDRLVIRSAGRVNGTVRYGKLVIEEGGELGGDVKALNNATAMAIKKPEAPTSALARAPGL